MTRLFLIDLTSRHITYYYIYPTLGMPVVIEFFFCSYLRNELISSINVTDHDHPQSMLTNMTSVVEIAPTFQ